ncbi:MAG TPA: hypothetical protein GXX47_08140 [Firmicutes bacterium]|nr:hypothetical protein [Bacillota bacterium]
MRRNAGAFSRQAQRHGRQLVTSELLDTRYVGAKAWQAAGKTPAFLLGLLNHGRLIDVHIDRDQLAP